MFEKMLLSVKECVFLFVGIALIIFGVLLSISWKDFYSQMLAQKLTLEKGSESYEGWKNPPFELNFDVYFFNWTNPTNFTTAEYEKPILEEIGPYRFREKTEKTQIHWNYSNSTVSYRKRSTYYFVPEESQGRLDDVIVTINMVAISAANAARNWPPDAKKQVSMGLNLYNQEVFIIKEARELLFDGYQDDMIDMALYTSQASNTLNIPYDRFGWFYKRNGSDDFGGYFNIHTGKNNIDELGTMKNWNFQSEMKHYSGHCNQVRGSGGELFPPGQTKEKPISIFTGDLCRPLDLFFVEEQNINGLNAYKYSATEFTFDNGQKYAANQCFSTNRDILPGVMNISSCRFGAPVFISMPHFYAADQQYLNFTNGLSPSVEKHAFYVTLDPNTGIPVEVAARLQINIYVDSFPNIQLYQEAPKLFFPAIWFEQKVRIPNDVIADLKIASTMSSFGYICSGIMVIIGILFVMIFIRYCRLKRVKKSHNVKEDAKNGGNELCSSRRKTQSIERISMETPVVKRSAAADIRLVHRAPLSVPEDFDSLN